MQKEDAAMNEDRITDDIGARELADFLGKDAAELKALKSSSGRISREDARELLSGLNANLSFRTLAHINMRGGIGKTTATISLATRAAQLGYKVCILDLDSQGSASLAFRVVLADDDPVFYDVWQKPDEMLLGALREVQSGLCLLPSSLQNGLLDSALANPVSQKRAVRGVCDVLKANGFDLVIVDCPPSLGAAVISTICAAETIVVPSGADAFSMKGIQITTREIGSICETFGLPSPQIRILYSRFDRRERVSLAALERLQETYPEELLGSVIRTSSEFNKALGRSKTIFAIPGRSRAKDDYDGYVREILGIPYIQRVAEQVAAQAANAEIVRTVKMRREELADVNGIRMQSKGEDLMSEKERQQG